MPFFNGTVSVPGKNHYDKIAMVSNSLWRFLYNENHLLYECFKKAYGDEPKRIRKRISGNEINRERNKEEIQVPAGGLPFLFRQERKQRSRLVGGADRKSF